MLPLYEDPGFTFHFADDRIIPRFHLDGVEPGRRVVVHMIDPVSSQRLSLLATAVAGNGGWVDWSKFSARLESTLGALSVRMNCR